MNVLSPFAATSGTAASRGTGDVAPADKTSTGGDDSFAQMIDSGSGGTSAPPTAQAREKPKAPADGGAKDGTAKKDAGKPAHASRDASGKPAETPEASAGEASASPQPADGGHDDTDAEPPAWPPAGLSSLGLASPALPADTPPPAADASTTPLAMQAANAGASADRLQASAALPTAPDPDNRAPAVGRIEAEPAETTMAPIAVASDALAAADTDTGTAIVPDGEGFAALMSAPASAAAAKPEVAAPFTGAPTAIPDLDSDDFGNAIGVRLGWLADQKIGHAHIHINPENLGPVEVRLQLDGDRVHASFSSAHADVRQALEGSLPRLREMLGQQGLQLGQADVGRQQQENPGGQASAVRADADGLDGIDTAVTTLSPVALRLRGLLDAYA